MDHHEPAAGHCDHHSTHKAHLTLFDVAKQELKHHHQPIHNSDDVYHKLNEMMVAHGHQKANIDCRTHINDHMLPKEWNRVDPHSILEHHGSKHHPEKDHPHPHPTHPQEPPADSHPHQTAHRQRSDYAPYYSQGRDSGQQAASVFGNLIGGIGSSLIANSLGRGMGFGGYRGYNPGYGGGGYGGFHPGDGGYRGYGGYGGGGYGGGGYGGGGYGGGGYGGGGYGGGGYGGGGPWRTGWGGVAPSYYGY